MSYIPMYELLPELAKKETRTITVLDYRFGIPPWEYGLVEMYKCMACISDYFRFTETEVDNLPKRSYV